MRILIVDDEPQITQICTHHSEWHGSSHSTLIQAVQKAPALSLPISASHPAAFNSARRSACAPKHK